MTTLDTPKFNQAVRDAVDAAFNGGQGSVFDTVGAAITRMKPSEFEAILDELEGAGYKVNTPAFQAALAMTEDLTISDLRRLLNQTFVRHAMESEALGCLRLSPGKPMGADNKVGADPAISDWGHQ